MTPTAKLRWLLLPMTGTVGTEHPSAIPYHGLQVRVLQQWWANDERYADDGEWRDIPIAREE